MLAHLFELRFIAQDEKPRLDIVGKGQPALKKDRLKRRGMHQARSGSSQTAPARQRSLPDPLRARSRSPETSARIDFDAADFDPSNRGDFTPGDFPGSPPDGGQSADSGHSAAGKAGGCRNRSEGKRTGACAGRKPQTPGGGFGGGNGSSDVKLQYIDDDPESYQNIFGNAKTDVSSNDEAWLIESLKKAFLL